MEIVYFVTTPLIKRDLELYGVEFYNKNGIDVYFFNFWPLFSNGLSHKCDIKYENQIDIDTIATLYKNFVKFKKRNSIFISDISLTNKRIILYILLTIVNINYSFVDNWYALPPLPSKSRLKKKSIITKFHKHNFLKVVNSRFQKLLNSICILIFNVFLKKPNNIFMPNHNSLVSKKMIGKKTKVIPYCSFNFDSFIELANKNIWSHTTNNNYFVYIDQYLTNHPDFYRQNIIPPVSEAFNISLNKFTKEIANKTKLDFVAALHPRRPEQKNNGINSDFNYYYKTAELIKNSSFVIAHYSVAIDFAVLFNKPILLLTSNELEKSDFKYHIESRAKELKCEIINIDNYVDFEKILSGLFDITDERLKIYNNYKTEHIVYNSDNTLKTYEIIFKVLFNQ